jgi:hypothetical protein
VRRLGPWKKEWLPMSVAQRVGSKISILSIVATSSLVTHLFCVSGGAAQTPALPDAVDQFIKAEMARQQIPEGRDHEPATPAL